MTESSPWQSRRLSAGTLHSQSTLFRPRIQLGRHLPQRSSKHFIMTPHILHSINFHPTCQVLGACRRGRFWEPGATRLCRTLGPLLSKDCFNFSLHVHEGPWGDPLCV